MINKENKNSDYDFSYQNLHSWAKWKEHRAATAWGIIFLVLYFIVLIVGYINITVIAQAWLENKYNLVALFLTTLAALFYIFYELTRFLIFKSKQIHTETWRAVRNYEKLKPEIKESNYYNSFTKDLSTKTVFFSLLLFSLIFITGIAIYAIFFG